MTKIISLDFELASEVNLTDTGAVVWTRCPTTIPIVAGFALDYEEPQAIDFDLIRPPVREVTAMMREEILLDAVKDGAEIHAWNANFEFNVWNNVCVPRFKWPALPIERFHCTMASAACAGLPMSLAHAAEAVGSPVAKDAAGHRLMMQMSKPRKIDSDGTVHWWHREDPAKLAQLTAYCLNDVRAEREVHYRTPRMTKREREIWLADQRMNMRGLPVDADLLTKLHAITRQEMIRIARELDCITQGALPNSQVNVQLLKWVRARGYPHDTLGKSTLTGFIGSPEFHRLDHTTQAVLRLRAEAAKSSTSKLVKMAAYVQPDHRIRNLVQYGGATRTLRWAGRGPQIQNYPRPVVKHVAEAIDQIKLGLDADGLRLLFGRPLDVVSSCLRGTFEASPGKTFVVADYHAIEAIVLAWLADAQDALEVFRRGEDIYVYTAVMIGSSDRMLGKVLRLACGYGMGPAKFQTTAAGYGLAMSLAEAQNAVGAFRTANKPIVELWHACERCAGNAILNPSTTYTFKRLKFRMADPKGRLKGSLLMELPSGRNLVYRNARIENGRIVFWGVDQYTRQWKELDTYGGKLVENATQAIARDLLADAVVELDRLLPDTLCTTVHDEIIAECDEENARAFLAEMLHVMSHPEPWAVGMPLSANGDIGARYGKMTVPATKHGADWDNNRRPPK